MKEPPVLSAEMFERLLRPSAVTIVGASPNGHVTEHLVRNLRNRSCRFKGPTYLVNPHYRRVFDLECLPGPETLPGPPGLVYLLVPGAACIGALAAFRHRPDGVVLFPDASREVGGYEEQVAAWGRRHEVAVLGPQSNGLVSPTGLVNGLLIPIVDRVDSGGVAILAQSGGILGGIVKFLAERGIGIHSALEYGTACMVTPWMLGERLAGDPAVRLIALYADGLDSISGFSSMLDAAHQAGKATVVMVAGASTAARAAIGSHSGMAATPRRILEGLVEQNGAVLAHDLDELVWAIEAIAAAGFRAPSAGQVALFSDSGGGGIAVAEAIEGHGMSLPPPDEEVREVVAQSFGESLNPFDFGSAKMGLAHEQATDIAAVAADSRYGILAFASTIGMALRERSVHIKQLDEFAATVESLGRMPFIASPVPFRDEPGGHVGSLGLYGNGSKESAVKLRALSRLAGATPAQREDATAAPASSVAVTGAEAQELLGGVAVAWPRQVTVGSVEEIEQVELDYPLVAKTEAGFAHRAREGGVLPGLARRDDLRNAVAYLLGRFGGKVSITEFVPHDEEYFLGAQRIGDDMFLLLGSGGSEAERAGVRLTPLRADQAVEFAAARTSRHVDRMASLVLSFQSWLLETTGIASVDLNPIVPGPTMFVALDAKIHRA